MDDSLEHSLPEQILHPHEMESEKDHVILQWLDSMDCTFEHLYADIERSFETCFLNLSRTADEEYEALQNDIKHIRNKVTINGSESSSSNNGEDDVLSVRGFDEPVSDECDDGDGSVAQTMSNGSIDADYELKAYPDVTTYKSTSYLNKENVERLSSGGRRNSEPYSIKNLGNNKSYTITQLEPSRLLCLTKTYLNTYSSLDGTSDENNDFAAELGHRDKLRLHSLHSSYVDGGYVTSDELEEATDSIINAMSKLCTNNGTTISKAFVNEQYFGSRRTHARNRRKTRRKRMNNE